MLRQYDVTQCTLRVPEEGAAHRAENVLIDPQVGSALVCLSMQDIPIVLRQHLLYSIVPHELYHSV